MQIQEEAGRLVCQSLHLFSTKCLRSKHKILSTWKLSHSVTPQYPPDLKTESEFTQHNTRPFDITNISEFMNVITRPPTKSTLFFFGEFYNFACERPVDINQRFQTL